MDVDLFRNWSDNLRRLVFGRPPWSADREFAFYRVDEELVRQHRDRQVAFARGAYLEGLGIVRAFDLLDTAQLHGKTVLDLGAGECLLAAGLAAAGASSVWALDAVPKQIWAAAAHHHDATNLHFALADARDLPFEDDSFDLCTANLLLHHVEPLEPLLRETLRVLRPGGRFVAVEPAPILGSLIHEKTSENEAPISPGMVKRTLAAAGFDAPRSEYYWSRLNTSKLGALSPGFRVSAQKPGTSSGPANVTLRRPLVDMKLRGLQLDEGCQFADLALRQATEIDDILARL